MNSTPHRNDDPPDEERTDFDLCMDALARIAGGSLPSRVRPSAHARSTLALIYGDETEDFISSVLEEDSRHSFVPEGENEEQELPFLAPPSFRSLRVISGGRLWNTRVLYDSLDISYLVSRAEFVVDAKLGDTITLTFRERTEVELTLGLVLPPEYDGFVDALKAALQSHPNPYLKGLAETKG